MPKSNQTGRTATSSERVMKDLSPEELSVLSNMGQQIEQILSMSSGASAGQGGVAAGAGAASATMQKEEEEEGGDGGPAAGPGGANYHGPTFTPGSPKPSRVEGSAKKEEEEDDEEDTASGAPAGERMQTAPSNPNKPRQIVKVRMSDGKVRNAIIVADPDASTGSSTADERIEDLPEWDEENVDDVAKAILRMAMGAGVIKKSARPQNPLVVAMAKIAKAMESIAEKQSIHDRVLTDIVDSLGVTKGLEEAENQVSRRRPVGTMPQDQTNVVKELATALASVMKGENRQQGPVGTGSDLSQSEKVHKSMSELALAMSQIAGDAWNPRMVGE